MKSLPPLPEIPEEERTPLVKALLGLLEQYGTRIVVLEEAVAGLKDEINVLKGEKKRPGFKPSGMASGSDKKPGGTGSKGDKRAGSNKRSKNAQLTIHEELSLAPSTALPLGSRFKGYRDFVVQDLLITSHNTRYRLEHWITPRTWRPLTERRCAAPMTGPPGGR